MNPLWSSPQLRLDVRACGFYSLEQNPRVIRMALGALPKQILVLVLQSGARLALFGVAVGIASGILVTRLMTRLLYQVSASNPFVFGGSAALFTFALLACYVPARRAARDDPITCGHCK
jgi:putative ABC transport system permease protein